MLLSLVFAVTLSSLPALVKTLAASLMVAESGFLAAKDTLNWAQGVMTERNQAIFNILGGGIGNPNSRLPLIQVTIASCPCRTASS